MELDTKDRKILFELEKDARQPNSSIAKSVGLSQDSIAYRIKQLENKGIVRGYRTLIDSNKLGYSLYRIYLRFIDVSGDQLIKIIDFLKKDKNSWWIGRLDGSWDFAFAYWSKSEKEFYDFYFSFQNKFRKYLKDKLISPILSYKEIPKRYLTNSKINFNFNLEEDNVPKFDKMDLEILRILSKNSRVPLIDLASKLKKDNMTIYHRIKKLEDKKIILGYKLDLDVSKLNRDFYTVEIDLNDFSKIEELKTEIYSLPQLTARSVSIGGNDLEFDLELENTQEYYKIIDNLKSRFPEIREIRYFRVIENYKILYMPEE